MSQTQEQAPSSLSHGVIAGLVILGFALGLLLFTIGLGYWLRKKAAAKPRFDGIRAVGIEWNAVTYRIAPPSSGTWSRAFYRRNRTRYSAAWWPSLQKRGGTSQQRDTLEPSSRRAEKIAEEEERYSAAERPSLQKRGGTSQQRDTLEPSSRRAEKNEAEEEERYSAAACPSLQTREGTPQQRDTLKPSSRRAEKKEEEAEEERYSAAAWPSLQTREGTPQQRDTLKPSSRRAEENEAEEEERYSAAAWPSLQTREGTPQQRDTLEPSSRRAEKKEEEAEEERYSAAGWPSLQERGGRTYKGLRGSQSRQHETHELRNLAVLPSNTSPATDKSRKSLDKRLDYKELQDRETILDGVSSRALPGTLNFIIGPSGAGKSSLVDILSGRQKRGEVEGTLAWLVDEGEGQTSCESAKIVSFSHRQIALVDQDDSSCLPAYLTVSEALAFAAELSVPENVSKVERQEIVEHTIDALGLSEVRHSRIGDSRSRGISGGERRRVSLGIAMVGRPKVLIADECTSGLDAFSALRVINALRRLASGSTGGTTVLATLHQPSSQIFHLADNVVLLGKGRILFDGRPSEALRFCQDSGFPVPPGHNVADHLLTYAFEVQEQQHAPLGYLPSRVRHDDASDDLNFMRSPLSLDHGGDQPVTTFITQLHALIARSLLMTRRDMLGAVAHIAGSAIVAVFVGACFFKVKLNLGGFQNRVGSMFFIFILALFSGLSAINGLAKVRLLMMRERANSLYSPWSWVASHLLYDLVLLRAIPSILIVSIVYWMAGLNPSAALFFQFVLIAVVHSWTVAIYNMLIAALVEDAGTTILLASLFVLFNLFMAGFLMSLDSMPSAVRWLRWLVPTKYALEAVASSQLQGLQFVDTFGGVPVRTDVSIFANKLFAFEDHSYYRDLIVLACGFLVGFGLLLFSAVWWRMRELR